MNQKLEKIRDELAMVKYECPDCNWLVSETFLTHEGYKCEQCFIDYEDEKLEKYDKNEA